MQLKARMDECMSNHCDPLKAKAEAIAKKFGLDQDRRKQAQAADHVADVDTFVNEKTWSTADVIQYQMFEDCFNGC